MEPETIIKQAIGSKYEIQSVIGKGGMSTVYKAIQKSLNRPVALKIIHQNLVHDDEFIKRFIREAQVCASLRHPNIIIIHDVGSVDTVHYMAMDYLEGQNLREIIQQEGNLEWEETLKYIEPIAGALDYMHQRQVIHRDVKSANIFITRDGQPVLMDFGIVLSASYEALSQAGTMLGTPEYMSPEQAEGKIKIDCRSDIYSLGVVMFECLTGKLPFHSDNFLSTLVQVIHDTAPSPKFINSKIPEWLNNIVLACLTKDRKMRIQSGSILLTDLRTRQFIKTIHKEEEFGTRKMESSEKSAENGLSPDINYTARKKKGWVFTFLIAAICILLIVLIYLVFVPAGNGVRLSINQPTDKQNTSNLNSERQTLKNKTEAKNTNGNTTSNHIVVTASKENVKQAMVLDLVQQGNKFLKEGDPITALAKYKEALQLSPANNQIIDKITFASNAWDKKQQDSQNPAEANPKKINHIQLVENAETVINPLRDANGNTYKTIKIGGQLWMAENLKTTKYNDGTAIQLITDDEAWEALSTPAYCLYNSGDTPFKDDYGKIYNWYVVNTGKVCPLGWHLPSDFEWEVLIKNLGGSEVAGGKLKAMGSNLWALPNEGATNEAAFNALPGGYRDRTGKFYYGGTSSYWWSSTETSTNEAWSRDLYYSYSGVNRDNYDKRYGFSVRCVKN